MSSRLLTSVERARAYMDAIPAAISGQNGHDRTFAVASALVNGFALSEYDALILLREYNLRCQPPWSEKELFHKVQSANQVPYDRPRGYLLGNNLGHWIPPRQTLVLNKSNPRQTAELFLKEFRCSETDIVNASPITPPDNWQLAGAWIMPFLYRDDEFININRDFDLDADGKVKIKGSGLILSRNQWIERLSKGPFESEAGAWIRMNPTRCSGTGRNKAICDSDVTSCRFALLECDDALPRDLQLALFSRLALPISLIVCSGGKSIHAWVHVDAENKKDYDADVPAMLNALGRFGIDIKNKNLSRFSRLPGARRKLGGKDGGCQKLLYLTPNPQMKPIL